MATSKAAAGAGGLLTSGAPKSGLRILIAGASGMIGTALQESLSIPRLGNQFHPEIHTLVRHEPTNDREVFWNPYEGRIDIAKCEGFDAIVNLAGENAGTGEGLLAFTGRWTERKKHMVMETRRRGNGLLAQAVAAMQAPPGVLLCASGIGYYGSNLDGSVEIDESAPKGTGFLSDVAAASEAALQPAYQAGVRTASLRLGVVISQRGGALERMLLPFKLGLGGPLGDGKQYMGAVSLRDVVRAIEHVIRRKDIEGALNVVAPTPCTNAEFAKALASELHRPAFFSVPETVLKTVMGEFAEDALLCSQRVVPTAILKTGFRFKDNNIAEVVHSALED